ncbi:putative phage protein [Selenomonas ruminantium subsp. lactilytica TAM6421]|uniref:Putative phage protein n=1 Tax=Selenomonas ruminantium subsp. lactilytica (strain NBRC 103574 / TAM6421) TaxID=927704 RepID=I0GS02_SELRL|nr:hypothetical protein [Selenomonas ruminantium]BAL83539.1 putative phage protein [Selenomonas ruminantium subsp. lactilytica TAM6421]
MKRGRKEKVCALYKGEKFVTEGTYREISEKTGIKVSTLRFYHYPAHSRRCRGNNHYELIYLED